MTFDVEHAKLITKRLAESRCAYFDQDVGTLACTFCFGLMVVSRAAAKKIAHTDDCIWVGARCLWGMP